MYDHVFLVTSEHLVGAITAKRDLEVACDMPREQMHSQARGVAERFVVREKRVGQVRTNLGFRERLDFDRNSDNVRSPPSERRLVEFAFSKPYGIRLYRCRRDVVCVGGHKGRVDSTRQKRRDRHVAFQVLLYRLAQQGFHVLTRFVE